MTLSLGSYFAPCLSQPKITLSLLQNKNNNDKLALQQWLNLVFPQEFVPYCLHNEGWTILGRCKVNSFKGWSKLSQVICTTNTNKIQKMSLLISSEFISTMFIFNTDFQRGWKYLQQDKLHKVALAISFYKHFWKVGHSPSVSVSAHKRRGLCYSYFPWHAYSLFPPWEQSSWLKREKKYSSATTGHGQTFGKAKFRPSPHILTQENDQTAPRTDRPYRKSSTIWVTYLLPNRAHVFCHLLHTPFHLSLSHSSPIPE